MSSTVADITELIQASATSGKKVLLPEGTFEVKKSVQLHDGAHICGSGALETTLILAEGVNEHMFTNVDHRKGNNNIRFENLRISGNKKQQWKPATERRSSFCNAMYLVNVGSVSISNVHVFDVLQTAVQFSFCRDVSIDGLHTENTGWSGLGTTGTDNVVVTNLTVINSGVDDRHSAVHVDGGACVYVQGVIRGSVGNGVMLDATYGKLANCLLRVSARDCMRGVALIGNSIHQMTNICVSHSTLVDNEIGVMISNASGAFVLDSHIEGSREFGVLFQGKTGGCDSFVVNCSFARNVVDVKQLHQSRNNIIIGNEPPRA
jgi:hypothetical protein